MHDLPLLAVIASVWIYWSIVGAMSWRVRRRTRRLAGVVPEQKLERVLWLAWVPMVVLWMALPMIALHTRDAPFAVPSWAREGVVCERAGRRRRGRGVRAGRHDRVLEAHGQALAHGGDARRAHGTRSRPASTARSAIPSTHCRSSSSRACAVVLPTWPMIAVALTQRHAREPQGAQRGAPPARDARRRLCRVPGQHRPLPAPRCSRRAR